MGFFSEEAPDDGLLIDLFLDLDSIHTEIVIRMIVLESRASADAENPDFGCAVCSMRIKISRSTPSSRVNQRQYEQLQRRTN